MEVLFAGQASVLGIPKSDIDGETGRDVPDIMDNAFDDPKTTGWFATNRAGKKVEIPNLISGCWLREIADSLPVLLRSRHILGANHILLLGAIPR
ncbi:MAG: hypothetical protein GX442_19915 [Candidatus Riflebacteria bacterium]|nr:hypothetical protein [Candidatus Riflebacteria bacterium]